MHLPDVAVRFNYEQESSIRNLNTSNMMVYNSDSDLVTLYWRSGWKMGGWNWLQFTRVSGALGTHPASQPTSRATLDLTCPTVPPCHLPTLDQAKPKQQRPVSPDVEEMPCNHGNLYEQIVLMTLNEDLGRSGGWACPTDSAANCGRSQSTQMVG